MSWAAIKRSQAEDADELAAVASGIGEYGVANACYRLAELLRRQAREIGQADNIGDSDRWEDPRDTINGGTALCTHLINSAPG